MDTKLEPKEDLEHTLEAMEKFIEKYDGKKGFAIDVRDAYIRKHEVELQLAEYAALEAREA